MLIKSFKYVIRFLKFQYRMDIDLTNLSKNQKPVGRLLIHSLVIKFIIRSKLNYRPPLVWMYEGSQCFHVGYLKQTKGESVCIYSFELMNGQRLNIILSTTPDSLSHPCMHNKSLV